MAGRSVRKSEELQEGGDVVEEMALCLSSFLRGACELEHCSTWCLAELQSGGPGHLWSINIALLALFLQVASLNAMCWPNSNRANPFCLSQGPWSMGWVKCSLHRNRGLANGPVIQPLDEILIGHRFVQCLGLSSLQRNSSDVHLQRAGPLFSADGEPDLSRQDTPK